MSINQSEEIYTKTIDQYPDKGRNVIGVENDGTITECYRCTCSNPNCTSWRCALTGYEINVNIIKWKYK